MKILSIVFVAATLIGIVGMFTVALTSVNAADLRSNYDSNQGECTVWGWVVMGDGTTFVRCIKYAPSLL